MNGIAAGLGQSALALTDFMTLGGAVRFQRAAREAGIKPVVGAELLVEGHPLVLLALDRGGYGTLCRLLSRANADRDRASAVVAGGAYVTLAMVYGIAPKITLAACLAFTVLFPMWFHRYARSIFLAIDYYVHPQASAEAPQAEVPGLRDALEASHDDNVAVLQ